MNENDKLGLRIMLGIALLIGGTYLLFRIFGDSLLIALLAFVGWFVIAGYTIKYMGWMKK